ncbi:MAG: hypothetical protein AAF514_10770, partial [Verrucomicrobiota bacterium]
MPGVEGQRIRIGIVGCGDRGQIYANYARLRPERCEVVFLAEPRTTVREKMAAEYGIPADR